MDKELYQLSEQLGKTLLQKNLVCVTAESCTGGGIAEIITAVPGSSQWFDRGFVTYSNDAKMDLVHVPKATLSQCGAVSQETVEAMAKGALAQSKAQLSMAVTGIAGPTGATSTKPIGFVWIGWAFLGDVYSQSFHFNGSRDAIRRQTVLEALKGAMHIVEKQ